jgi:hypothetical protein
MAKADEKLDLYKQYKAEYVKPKTPTLVDVGPATYLSIDRSGEPCGETIMPAMGAIFAVAYAIKMTRKFAGLGDYKVCAPEGLYWVPCKYQSFEDAPKSEWQWKMMIRTPDFITRKDLAAAQQTLIEKGKDASVKDVRLETIDEGRCVQMLHVGPYGEVRQAVARMLEFATGQGLAFQGRYHEIYLSDPRRVAPEKLKTLLRHPVCPR